MPVNTIDEALLDIRKGKMVILVDDEERENEGDLCFAAENRNRRPQFMRRVRHKAALLFKRRLQAIQ